MLATYACAAGICGLSLGIGALVCRLGGAGGWSWLAPGAGLATAICVASVAVRLPGHGWTALAVLLGLAIAGVAVSLSGRGGAADAADRDAGPLEAAAVALVVLAAVSIPFLVSGRFGLLGAGINDDLGFHLSWTEALANGEGADRLIAQLDPGYPIGPHSAAAALVRPLDPLAALTGLMMAVPVLAALTALAALRDVRPPWRVAGAVATGIPYTAVSYFAEGSFKEPVLALLVLTFALSMSQLRPPALLRRGLVPGLAAIAAVLTFGRGGLAWPLAMPAAWLAAELIARRRQWLPWLRRVSPALLAVAAVLAVGLLVNLGRLQSATLSGSFPDQADNAGGNFVEQISIFPVFGGWPSPDFRLPSNDDVGTTIAAAIAVLAVAYGAAWWSRRRELAMPAAAVASLIICWRARAELLPYHAAKALAVAAPLLTLLAVRAAFAGLPRPGRIREITIRSRTDLARMLLGLAFVGVVLWSSGLALRNAPVSAHGHAEELRSLRSLLNGPTVLLVRDHYARWELLGVPLGNLAPYASVPEVDVRPRPGKPDFPADFDSLRSADLDRFRFAVTARGPYASLPPPNWRVVRRTDTFEVWKRSGRTPRRAILDEGDGPGAAVGCTASAVGELRGRAGVAAVRRTPVVGEAGRWRWPSGAPAYVDPTGVALVQDGFAVRQSLRLPRGRWNLSLQYSSPVSLRVRAADLSAEPPAVTDPPAQYWPIGSLRSAGGRVSVDVEVAEAGFGAIERDARLGKLAATPARWGATLVPLQKACGRYVDWLRPGR